MTTPQAYSYIRFSNPEQEKGDSLRRQIKYSEQVAEKLGLTLDDSLRLTDRGLSAYKGDHRTKGALGEFLRLVDSDKITPGSLLILEHLDRLSREGMLETIHLLTGILLKGIDLYIAMDDKHFTKGTYDLADLIISATKLQQGHDESAKKSMRLSEAWVNKRAQAVNGKTLTRMTPEWIEVTTDGRMFAVQDRCEAIELIFRKKLAGKGSGTIARELNADADTWRPQKSKRNKSGGWRKSYINKILRNRAVIGEYQPCKLVDGRRQPVDDPIKGYFPSAVDEDLFYQVQELIRRNREQRGYAGGRTGRCNNLFTHVVKCGLCGGAMHYIDKGKTSKGGQYLHCDNARRLHTCEAQPVRYDEFERVFFEYFDSIDIDKLIPGEDKIKAQLSEFEKRMVVASQHTYETEQEVTNLTDSIRKTSDERVRERLDKALSKTLDTLEQYQGTYKTLEQEHHSVSRQRVELKNSIDTSNEIHRLLNATTDDEERISIRMKLRAELQRLLQYVKIVPLQEEYKPMQEVEPGVWRYMDSRCIARIGYRFRDGSVHGMISLTGRVAEGEY